ncbi:MAG: GH1 family beta-glucosidase [Candidatus Cloacimonas sp.]|jgi:beta-glucosidase|nr:GH1 family beta-glucosidase [Kiritimatiellia bacterium]MDY0152324.1 GH1 family beta-glucosidase [Candidatus Cloacimonas sp.]
MSTLQFPPDFVWGTATSAFQIEGATSAGGRGESIWDRFCRTPGRIVNGDHADVACDHYHRFQEDVALLADLGIPAYRFSIAWPRILPNGHGKLNPQGLDFYSRLVDELLAHGITPWPTLYHWDLPQALQDQGGWPERGTAEAFVEYVDIVTQALGDRVQHWFTHNEPWCVAMMGHARGEHAPGCASGPAALAAAHHVLLSHGASVPVIRANCPGAEVGIVLNLTPAYPASESEADRQAARRFDGGFNRWFLDPIHGRGYPADMVDVYRQRGWLPEGVLPFVQGEDLDTIAEPCDFLAINYYTRAILRGGSEMEQGGEPATLPPPAHSECTDMGWEVYPEGLRDLLIRVHQDYRPARLLIAENGCSYSDAPGQDGRIRDERRIQYLRDHLAQARLAMAEGVPLQGYFAWSLLDNFEWQFGHGQRFGLVALDPATGRRLPKDSAAWFARLVASPATSIP